VKVTLVELVAVPLVAVTVAVLICPVGALQDNIEVPLVPRTMLVTVNEQEAAPVAVTPRVTVPVKPPRDATVIVEVPWTVASVVTLDGLALRLIPGGGPTLWIVTFTTVEFVIALFVPPVPLIVTV
jgi:hypothetical protein